LLRNLKFATAAELLVRIIASSRSAQYVYLVVLVKFSFKNDELFIVVKFKNITNIYNNI